MNRPFALRGLRIGFALAFAGVLIAADDLPKGEALLDKYVEVTGGKAAYSKLHSEVKSGTVEIKAMGVKGKMMSYSAEPNKSYTEISFEGLGKIQEGSNGEIAWAMSAMQGPRIKEGDEKADTLQQAKFNADLNWRDVYKSAETVGVEQIDGKECYKVVLTPKSGAVITNWYDKETNLVVKMSLTARTAMGDIQSESLMSDYRKEGEILVPHKVQNKVATMEVVTTLDSVQHNVEIPTEKFEVPAEVKALMKKPAAK